MTIQETIAAKLEILHEATQARVDATHHEIRAAVDVIVSSVTSAAPHAAHIEFETDELSHEVGILHLLDVDEHLVPASDSSLRFWHRTAGIIAADEFMVAVPGVEPLDGPGQGWRLTIATYLSQIATWSNAPAQL